MEILRKENNSKLNEKKKVLKEKFSIVNIIFSILLFYHYKKFCLNTNSLCAIEMKANELILGLASKFIEKRNYKILFFHVMKRFETENFLLY